MKIKSALTLLISLLILTLLIVLGYLFLRANLRSQQFTLQGPVGTVSIKRDEYNVPHIKATTADIDAFYALGYVHAQDRLWQMEFQRRVVSGSLSEIFGLKTIKQDRYLRTWGFYRAAQQAWLHLDPATQKIVHAYTQGINAYLTNAQLPLPFYFLNYKPKPWTDVDSIAWQKMMAWNLDTSWERKIKNALLAKKLNSKQAVDYFLPAYSQQAPTILSNQDLMISKLITDKSNSILTHTAVDTVALNLKLNKEIRDSLGFKDDAGKGSNAWVISGKLSKTGKPLLADDVHLPLASPALWYLAELQGPTLHVTGATIPGLPLVAIGHNDAIAWGVTHSYADTQDLYIEDANTTPFTKRQEIIYIKNSAPETLTVLTSQHGPIISNISAAGKVDKLVAIKWPALDANDTTVTSFMRLNYARNWAEFVSALSYYVTPPQNFLYADTKGNIGYYLPGKIPLRNHWLGNFPIASHANLEWQGYIPFDKLPHIYNPPEGYIAAANNKIVSDAYPYSLNFRWSVPPYRIERINNYLREHSETKMTINDMIALQNDTYSQMWSQLKTTLLQTNALDQDCKDALQTLTKWDGKSDLQSQAAPIFSYWYQRLLKSTDDTLPFDTQFIAQQLQANTCYSSYTTRENCSTYLSKTLHESLAKLRLEQGNYPTWSKVHIAYFEEFIIGKSELIGWIWNRTMATPGSDYTVNVGTYDPITMQQHIGPTYRQIIDLSDFKQSLYVIPLGQQDDPFSLKYNDQLALWAHGKYLVMGF